MCTCSASIYYTSGSAALLKNSRHQIVSGLSSWKAPPVLFICCIFFTLIINNARAASRERTTYLPQFCTSPKKPRLIKIYYLQQSRGAQTDPLITLRRISRELPSGVYLAPSKVNLRVARERDDPEKCVAAFWCVGWRTVQLFTDNPTSTSRGAQWLNCCSSPRLFAS